MKQKLTRRTRRDYGRSMRIEKNQRKVRRRGPLRDVIRKRFLVELMIDDVAFYEKIQFESLKRRVE